MPDAYASGIPVPYKESFLKANFLTQIIKAYLWSLHISVHMSVAGLSLGKLAIILIIAGVVIVFAISGFQARDVLFAPNITEETQVIIKEQGTCTVQAEDDVPRTIENCPYDVGDTISITYKREQPPILEHSLVREQQG